MFFLQQKTAYDMRLSLVGSERYIRDSAGTTEQQKAVLDALKFKCNVLWSMLDALDYAYVVPGRIPPGAFHPDPRV